MSPYRNDFVGSSWSGSPILSHSYKFLSHGITPLLIHINLSVIAFSCILKYGPVEDLVNSNGEVVYRMLLTLLFLFPFLEVKETAQKKVENAILYRILLF